MGVCVLLGYLLHLCTNELVQNKVRIYSNASLVISKPTDDVIRWGSVKLTFIINVRIWIAGDSITHCGFISVSLHSTLVAASATDCSTDMSVNFQSPSHNSGQYRCLVSAKKWKMHLWTVSSGWYQHSIIIITLITQPNAQMHCQKTRVNHRSVYKYSRLMINQSQQQKKA